MATCPICHRTAAPRKDNAAFPFCGTRCRQIDLGKWLGEEYRISSPATSPEALEDAREEPS